MSPKETLSLVPNLPDIYDEPFADSSQIPTILLSQFTKNRVKVSLSGDGGDELFGGYNRYFWVSKIWKYFSWLPFEIRILIGKILSYLPPKKIGFSIIYLKEIKIKSKIILSVKRQLKLLKDFNT